MTYPQMEYYATINVDTDTIFLSQFNLYILVLKIPL